MIKYTKKQIEEQGKYYSDPNNLVDLFEGSVKKWGDRNAIGTKNRETREFEWITYKDLSVRIDNLRAALKKKGLKKNDTVGIIVANSVEWFVVEQATHGLGGRIVAMYENELFKTWEYIIKDSKIKYLFVRDQIIFDKVKGLKKKIETLKDIFNIYGEGKTSLKELEIAGSKSPVESYKPLWHEIANIVYTSGTTGDPKGVVLHHGNLTACTQAGFAVYPELNEESVSLAILPWAHSYGLSAELHNFLQFGGAIGLMESVETLGDDLAQVKPDFLIAVPRVFNKIYDGILHAMNEAGGAKLLLFNAACKAAKKCRDKEKQSLKLKILDGLVFSKIRAKFGGNLVGAMTASALMNPEIAMFFKDIGLPTYDCYGLTETAPAITMNSPLKGNVYGSVGQPMKNMNVVIDQSMVSDDSGEGEILAYGAHVMMGYLNKPKETKKMMTADTWNGFPGIRTGDQGRIDENGFLYVTGRFKDEYKLSNGKYVHPESIETEIKLLKYVANAMIFGDGKRYNVCVIVPDFEVLRADAATAQWTAGGSKKILAKREMTAFLEEAVTAHLKKSYAGYEIPKKYIFTDDDFTIENGMLTQTMKVKRREVMNVYGEKLLKLYDDDK
ncbi:MAG: AMP-binding protein [bacterium]|nr:AMP-binding protein [bacterium]